MTAKKAFMIILAGAGVFACAGGMLGGVLGTIAPDYYRGSTRLGPAETINPVHVGIGLGTTQGLCAGVVLALYVVMLLVWRDIQAAHANKYPVESLFPLIWGRVLFLVVIGAFSIAVMSCFAFLAGGVIAEGQLYQSMTDDKLNKLETILATQRFPGVQADYSSAAQVYLLGTVESSTSRKDLHDELVLAFGTEEADNILRLVDVEDAASPDDRQ